MYTKTRKKIDTFTESHHQTAYSVFRVLFGILFSFHGMQKVFGWFTANGAQPLFSLMGVVGVIELVGGLLIALGLFTRTAAFASGIVMIGAFFKAHFTLANPIPIANRGELALVYLVGFIFLCFAGDGKYSLRKMFGRK